MDHEPGELQRQIDELSRRLKRLEGLIDSTSPASPESQAAPAPEITAAVPSTLPSPISPRREALDRLTKPNEGSVRQVVRPSKPPKPPREPINLEQFVGARLFAVVGALVIVAGAALLLKIAWDAGWFSLLSDPWKCGAGAMFGAALLGFGEFARRRINAFASIGCSAAGIGVLYASAYAAYGFFGLIGHEAGFALLASVAALGVLVGARARLASVAGLSIIVAYTVPMFFLDVEPRPLVLPGYLASILVIGLVLSAALGGRFVWLRTLVWWGTSIFGAAWAVLLRGTDHTTIAVAFVAFCWAAIHAELIISARRRGITGDGEGAASLKTWRAVRPLASSFSIGAWAALLASVALFDATGQSWQAPAVLCAVTASIAIWLGSSLDVLRATPTNDTDRLASVLAIESGALLIAAIALGLAGWMENVAWVALGMGAIVAARTLRARPLDVYGLSVLSLVVLRLFSFGLQARETESEIIETMGLVLTRWSLLVAITGLAWCGAGLLLRHSVRALAEPQPWRQLGNACVAIGITLATASLLHGEMSQLAAVWALVGGASALLLAACALRSTGVRTYALVGPGLISALALLAAWYLSPADSQRGAFIQGAAPFTLYTLPMLAGVAFWIAAALLVHPGARLGAKTKAGTHPCVVGAVVLLYSCVTPKGDPWQSVVWLWLGVSVLVFAAHRLLPQLTLRRWAIGGLTLSIYVWFLAVVSPTGTRWSLSDAPTLAHAGLWSALAIAMALLGASVLIRRGEQAEDERVANRVFAIIAGIASVVLCWWATSLEVSKVAETMTVEEMSRRAAVSIWWGLFAIGLLIAGFRLKLPPVRHSGLALLGIATSKAVIFDLVEVPPTWRAVSFLALGLMMLAVGVVYAKVSASVAREQGVATGAEAEPVA